MALIVFELLMSIMFSTLVAIVPYVGVSFLLKWVEADHAVFGLSYLFNAVVAVSFFAAASILIFSVVRVVVRIAGPLFPKDKEAKPSITSWVTEQRRRHRTIVSLPEGVDAEALLERSNNDPNLTAEVLEFVQRSK